VPTEYTFKYYSLDDSLIREITVICHDRGSAVLWAATFTPPESEKYEIFEGDQIVAMHCAKLSKGRELGRSDLSGRG
jgi:hypothetical protein